MPPVPEYKKKYNGFSWRLRASYWSTPKLRTPSFLPPYAIMYCRCICLGPWPLNRGTRLLLSRVCMFSHDEVPAVQPCGEERRGVGVGSSKEQAEGGRIFLAC